MDAVGFVITWPWPQPQAPGPRAQSHLTMLLVTKGLAAGEYADNTGSLITYFWETNEDIRGHRSLTPWQGVFPWRREGSNDSCCCLVARSCPTLCDSIDCSMPGSSVSGISQARILEWVAISSSRGFSRLRDRTHISCIASPVL